MQSLALLICLSGSLFGDGGFSVEAPAPVKYKYEVELGTLPKFETEEDQKHIAPLIEDSLGPASKVPKKQVQAPKTRVVVYSKVPLVRLKKWSKECPPCLQAYIASLSYPEIAEDFDFEFTTEFPDWAEKLGQEPILHWKTCPDGKSKGIWMRQIGWTTPEAFLTNWDIAEGNIKESVKDAPKVQEKTSVSSSRLNYRSRSGVHWTHPRTIEAHLRLDHGVNTAGLSREQMLNLHDALHEGR